MHRSPSRNEDITGLKIQEHVLVASVTGFQPMILGVNSLLLEEQSESLAAFVGQIVQMPSSPSALCFGDDPIDQAPVSKPRPSVRRAVLVPTIPSLVRALSMPWYRQKP